MFEGKYKNFILLHFIVFIWGFTAILGKLISLQAVHLVWFRMIIAVAGIYVYARFKKTSLNVSGIDLLKFLGVGTLIAIHWLCFYGAIKVSNVSVTLACFSSGALFTSIVEPLIFKRRIDWKEVVCGAVAIVAISMIFKIETQYTLGILLSLGAAFTSSFFSVFNGILVRTSGATKISFYELLCGLAVLSVYLLLSGQMTTDFFIVSSLDWRWLLLLGLVCTALPFVVAVDIMKEISPYTISLTVNLETVYGIILALVIFQKSEQMSVGFYTGTIIILAAVFANAMLKRQPSPIKKPPSDGF